jgi:hypothetical protein
VHVCTEKKFRRQRLVDRRISLLACEFANCVREWKPINSATQVGIVVNVRPGM